MANVISNKLRITFITSRMRSMGQGNAFTRVCHSVRRGSAFPQCHGQADLPPESCTPPLHQPWLADSSPTPRYGQPAGGTHPTLKCIRNIVV